MNNTKSQSTNRRPPSLTRVLIASNFALFLLLLSPIGRSRDLYKAVHDAGFTVLFAAIPLWFGGTTLLVTTLFFWRAIRKSDEVSAEALRNKRLDSVLLVAWWIVLILACM